MSVRAMPAVAARADPVLARPILVGGCPRSGTTLVGAMLGVGPEVLTVPESDFKWPLVHHATATTPGLLDRRRVVARLAEDPRFHRWGVPPQELAETGTATFAVVLDELVRAHGRLVGKPQPRTWVDHTPWNIKYARSLADLLPQARFVHVVRDGRAVAASLRRLDWGPTTIDGAAHWWAAHVAMGLAAERVLGADRVVLVRYEDLVRRPEETLPWLQERLGLRTDADAVARRDFRVDDYTRPQHGLVAAPPDPSRVDAWASVLSDRHVEAFERRTGDLLSLLGYEPRFGSAARSPGTVLRLVDTVIGTLRRQLVQKPRRRRRERAGLRVPDRGGEG